jgi:stage II sporulation protein D
MGPMSLTCSRRPAAVVLVAGALVLSVSAAAPGAVDPGTEASVDPVGGDFTLEGHGYGHGRGMSQWGAEGAASLGIAYPQILSTYYPGTKLVTSGEKARIKVWLTGDSDGDLRVRPASGLRVSTGEHSKVLPATLADRKVTTWRVRAVSGTLRLEGYSGGSWRPYKVGGRAALASPVKLRATAGQVRMVLPGGSQRDYRGQAWAVADPKGPGGLRVVNNIYLESYLRSVVPSESFPSWGAAALRAQSVAARTYALWKARNTGYGFADICDTTSCQVYHGHRNVDSAGRITREWETASTDAAVAYTAGKWLQYAGAPALTEFSASNGGFSTKGDKPYLVARADPWDGEVSNAAHRWELTVPAKRITNRWPQLGTVVSLRVRERDGNGDWGGRVRSVEIVGTARTITLSGSTFSSAMGLRHPWFRGLPSIGGIDVLPGTDDGSAVEASSVEAEPRVDDVGVTEASAGRAVAPEQMQTTPMAPPPRP